MPKFLKPGNEVTYRAAEQFVSAALHANDSLFTPGHAIWSPEPIEDLYERFVQQIDETKDTFISKFERQLGGASDQTIQFAAEALYVHFLIASGINAGTKRNIVNHVLSWAGSPVTIPSDLDQALGHGLAKPGVAFHTHRPFQLKLIVTLVREWNRLSLDERTARLKDPWKFKAFLFSLPIDRAYMQREALLHLVHPDHFERILSRDVKQEIAESFSHLVAEPAEDVDRQIAQIRKRLEVDHGSGFDFYDDADVKSQWRPEPDPWDEFIAWIRRFFEWPGFDESERNYKLEIGRNFQVAKEAVLDGDEDWLEKLRRAFGNPNNLTSWRAHNPFVKWCNDEPNTARRQLQILWNDPDGVDQRIQRFLDGLPKDVVSGSSARIGIVSVLLMAEDPCSFAFYRVTTFNHSIQLTGYPPLERNASEAEQYLHALGFLDQIIAEATDRNVMLRDRLDAQSAIWCIKHVSPDDPPVIHWSNADRRAFIRYSGGETIEDEESDEVVDLEESREIAKQADSLEDLADRLLIDRSWLERVKLLLSDKPQLIFYGPPGTGKTYVALQFAQHLAGSGERVRLVQFHPSYAYEDFVEGYRPGEVAGQPHFRLVEGPLKDLASTARENPEKTYVLVVDEINRGNITKIFGELYFLLEYRDHQIRLQYSSEQFALPENLFILGTMNTADRSIALIDAALRRRFHFLPFFPTRTPVEGLLHRWLEREAPEMTWVARIVDEANHRLNDEHAAIGPSHFMNKNLDRKWLELIWDHSILPYLAEQFFGDEERLEEFALDTLIRQINTDDRESTTRAEDGDATPDAS